ncbi:MAG: alpha/beta hydrolase, partial [Chloroflexi bacterium]|nr:alpha/beta hydrolase [Chloroflexota bacterium]
KRNFRIVDFPGDVVALAAQLKLAKFAVLGYSGGGPFALACAAQIPGRLASLAVVSGVGPADIGPQGMHESNRKKFSLAQRLPWLARLMLWLVFSTLRRQPERLARQLKTIWQQMPEPDRQVLEQDQHFADGILAITRDALTSGVSGWVQEEILMTQPWQFEMNDVRVPHVQLWHGGLDRNVPVTMGRAVAGQIPNCRATFLDNEGHISLLYHHGREIVERLIQSGFQ